MTKALTSAFERGSEGANDLRRYAGDERTRRDIVHNHATRTDHAASADGHAAENDRADAEPYALLEHNRGRGRKLVAPLGLDTVKIVVHQRHVATDARVRADAHGQRRADGTAAVDVHVVADIQTAGGADGKLDGRDRRNHSNAI